MFYKYFTMIFTLCFAANVFCMELTNSKETNNNNSPAQQSTKWQKKEVPLSLAASCILSIIENLDQYDLEELKKAKYPEEMIQLFVWLKLKISDELSALNGPERDKEAIGLINKYQKFLANYIPFIEALAYLTNKFDHQPNDWLLKFARFGFWNLEESESMNRIFGFILWISEHTSKNVDLKLFEILANYIDLNKEIKLDFSEKTGLEIAATNGNLELVKYLISKGINQNILQAFKCAISYGNIDIVKYFYENNFVPKSNIWNGKFCPLTYAAGASKNRLALVKYFTEKGFNPNGMGRAHWGPGDCPLESAFNDYHTHNTGKSKEENLLEQIQTIEYLLVKGADINAFDYAFLYNLVYADKDPKIIEIYLKHADKKNIDLQTSGTNETALMRACFKRNLKFVQILIAAGADVNLMDYQGTALFYACNYSFRNDRKQSNEIISLLHKAGAKYNTRNYDGTPNDDDTIFHIAVQYNDEKLILQLLDLDCDPNIKNKQRLTPAMLALKENKQHLVKIFEEHAKKQSVEHNGKQEEIEKQIN